MKLLSSVFFAAAILLMGFHARAEEGFGELSIDQVADLVAKHGADVYDNNSQDDWRKGHVPSARWVSFKDVKASDLPQDHARTLVFYCANPH
jgi:hypothetical protein